MALILLLYKPVVTALRKARLVPESHAPVEGKGKLSAGFLLFSLALLATFVVLALVLGPLSAPTLENLFWFFTYHLTVTPVLILLPIFLLLGGLVPLAVYRSVGPGLRGGAAAGGGGLRRCPVKLHNRSEQTGPIPQDRAGLLMAFWQSRWEGAKIARKRKQGEHKTMKSPESEKKLRYFFRSA